MKNKCKNTNISLIFIVIILITIIVVSSIIGFYAWSKYISLKGGEATAQVAKWHFELKEGTTESGKTLLALTRTDEYKYVEEGKLAPGTNGELPIVIDTTTTEVDLKYYLVVTITNFPKNMLLYTADKKLIKPQVTGEGTDESPRVATIYISKYVPYRTADTDRLHDETIMWNWPYITGTEDSEVDENDKIDVQDAGKEVTVSVSVTGTEKLKDSNLKIGDTANLTTTLNGVELNNWKVFYKEGDYTYLILGDYLPNKAINDINGIIKKDEYTAISNNRENLINALTTKTNWSGLLKVSINGRNYDYTSTTDDKIYAQGSPTIDLYTKSWNEKYPNNQMHPTKNSTGGYYANYQYGDFGVLNTPGYSDTLYYPHQGEWNKCAGYWLASPSYEGPRVMVDVWCGGCVGNDDYNFNCACRPIICLPSDIIE